MDIDTLYAEIESMLSDIGTPQDGGHIWEPYQKVAANILRLQEVHNQLAWREVNGDSNAREKKFRTMIVDKTIEALEKVASYESRKITAKKIELELDR